MTRPVEGQIPTPAEEFLRYIQEGVVPSAYALRRALGDDREQVLEAVNQCQPSYTPPTARAWVQCPTCVGDLGWVTGWDGTWVDCYRCGGEGGWYLADSTASPLQARTSTH